MITGLSDLSESTLCFHAGTKTENGKLLSSGGRVLNIVCHDRDLAKAVEACYEEIKKINFDKMAYRTDIAQKALK